MHSPLELFETWYAEAQAVHDEPQAVALATATKNGLPSVRTVYFRGMKDGGFAFYTNYESHKGHDLLENPHAAMVFYWAPIKKQIRIEGTCTRLSHTDSQKYFEKRSRESQLSAWASHQSAEISNFEIIDQKILELEKQFKNKPIPCPPYWGGYLLTPTRIEFWTGQQHRRHHRESYEKQGSQWIVRKLSP